MGPEALAWGPLLWLAQSVPMISEVSGESKHPTLLVVAARARDGYILLVVEPQAGGPEAVPTPSGLVAAA